LTQWQHASYQSLPSYQLPMTAYISTKLLHRYSEYSSSLIAPTAPVQVQVPSTTSLQFIQGM